MDSVLIHFVSNCCGILQADVSPRISPYRLQPFGPEPLGNFTEVWFGRESEDRLHQASAEVSVHVKREKCIMLKLKASSSTSLMMHGGGGGGGGGGLYLCNRA